jgi:hypothetical protein
MNILIMPHFSEDQLNRVRTVSSQLEVVQESVGENWNGMDTAEFFKGGGRDPVWLHAGA